MKRGKSHEGRAKNLEYARNYYRQQVRLRDDMRDAFTLEGTTEREVWRAFCSEAPEPEESHEHTGNPKKCPDCQNYYPGTPEFFYRKRSERDGLDSYCKTCSYARVKNSRASHLDAFRARNRTYKDRVKASR